MLSMSTVGLAPQWTCGFGRLECEMLSVNMGKWRQEGDGSSNRCEVGSCFLGPQEDGGPRSLEAGLPAPSKVPCDMIPYSPSPK